MAETAPLSPEAIQRRRRQEQMRSPEQALRAKVGQLSQDEDKLEKLLEELLYLAERETIFTMTLERDRLVSALGYAGYIYQGFLNHEGQIGPGATTTTYIPVPTGFVISPIKLSYYNSLPWWLTLYAWIDWDFPAIPIVLVLRTPDKYEWEFKSFAPIRRFIRFTTTNNHLVNTINFLAVQYFVAFTEDVWSMVEEIYLKPIAEFAQEQAEKRTGRPYP